MPDSSKNYENQVHPESRNRLRRVKTQYAQNVRI